MNTIKILISSLGRKQDSSSVHSDTKKMSCNYKDNYYGDQRCHWVAKSCDQG